MDGILSYMAAKVLEKTEYYREVGDFADYTVTHTGWDSLWRARETVEWFAGKNLYTTEQYDWIKFWMG